MVLTETEVAEFIEVFDLFDNDHDGLISLDQLRSILYSCGEYNSSFHPSVSFRLLDSESDRMINVQEFLSFLVKSKDASSIRTEIVDVFRMFDKNGDGMIAVDDIKEFYKSNQISLNLTDREVDELLKGVIQDGDGLISIDEYVDLLLIRENYDLEKIKNEFII